MNKMPSDQTHNPDDTLEAEYSFDYKKGKPNRFAAKIARQISNKSPSIETTGNLYDKTRSP